MRAWQSHGHGLHVRSAPALAAAGQHERVGGGVQAAQLVLADVPRQHADPRQQVPLLRACQTMKPSQHNHAALRMLAVTGGCPRP